MTVRDEVEALESKIRGTMDALRAARRSGSLGLVAELEPHLDDLLDRLNAVLPTQREP